MKPRTDKKQRGTSIFRTLFYALGAMGLLVAMVSGAAHFYFTLQLIESSAREEMADTVSDASAYLERSYGATVEDDLHMLSASPTVEDLLITFGNNVYIRRPPVERLFVSVYESRPEIYESLSLFDATGNARVRIRHGKREHHEALLAAGERPESVPDKAMRRLFHRLAKADPGAVLYEGPLRLADGHPGHEGHEGSHWIVLAGIAREEPEIGGFGGAIMIEMDLAHYIDYLSNQRVLGYAVAWLFSAEGELLSGPGPNRASFDPRPYLDTGVAPPDRSVMLVSDLGGHGIASRLRVVFAMSPETFEGQFEQAGSLLLFVLSLVLVLGSLGALLVARHLAAPIRDLSKALNLASRGNLAARVPRRWRGEMGQMATAFNQMADSLQRSTVSVEHVNNIINSMNEALIVIDDEGRIATANPAVTRLLGFEPDAIAGTPVSALFTEPRRIEARMRAENSYRSFANMQTALAAADGRAVPVSLSGSPLSRDPSANGAGYVLVAQDETESQRVAQELARQKNLFEAIVEHVPDALLIADTDNRLVSVNRATSKLFGYSKQELAGQKARLVFASDEQWMKVTGHAGGGQWAARPLAHFETQFRRKNGEVFPGEARHAPVPDADGRILGFVGLVRDLTDRHRADEALRRQIKSVHLLRRLASAANEARVLGDALWLALKEICEFTGWTVGHVWDFSESGSPSDGVRHVWHMEHSEAGERFKAASESYTLGDSTTGLSNRALNEGEPVWVRDVTESPGFGRVELARELDLHAGFAFPVVVGERVRVVAEFFAEHVLDPDPALMALMANVGTLLGRVIEREDAKRALEAGERRFRDLYDKTPASFFTVDREGTILSVNAFGADHLGYRSEELLGRNFQELQGSECARNQDGRLEECFAQPDASRNWETCLYRSDGREIKVRIHGRVAASEDGSGRHLLLACEDVTESRRLSARLLHQARHDPLTGLLNRWEFERIVGDAIDSTRTEGSRHVLCCLDLDQFKVINDTCGHRAGDELLRQIAGVLREHLRKSDTVVRLGGDEFGILMRDCSIEDGHRVAEQIRSAVEEFRFEWQRVSFDVGVSIGVVPVTASTGDAAEVLSTADTACYAAKDAGRNRVHVALPEDEEFERQRAQMHMVSGINDAIENDRLKLFVQPIVSLAGSNTSGTGRCNHYEVLLRMQSPEGRILPPGAFLPAAERYNVISKIDIWTVNNSLDWLARNPEILEGLATLSINLSGKSIDRREVLDAILDAFDRTAIPPGKICFEITETAAVANLSSATRFIKTLKGIGCRFALDDFGSGLSSFGYLKNLAVDVLKIDGVFVRDILDDPIDRAMVKSINELAHVMGKRTVAEFVENDEIADMLRAMGVDYAQGYGMGRPGPIDDMLLDMGRVHEDVA